MPPSAIIAGAGIGGLAASIALSQAGFKVALYEQANKLEEIGAGLQLTPNATRVLARLGALERVGRLSSRPQALLILRGSNDSPLACLPLADAERRWGADYLVVHRADLQSALIETARERRDIELMLGCALGDFTQEEDRISVDLWRNGVNRRDEANLLVGADGLRSRVRAGLGFGPGDRPAFTGHVAYRALLDANAAPVQSLRTNIVMRMGPNAHLVQYPLRGGSTINLVATISSPNTSAAGEDWDGAADRSILDMAFSGWSKAARALIHAPDEWRTWPLYSRPPVRSFSRGRAALLGDAAHPMVPFLAQGAAQAIEDAGALGRILAQTPDIPTALELYSRARVGRVARIQREALRQGWIYHLSGPMAIARDLTMKILGPRRLAERYDWLYRG